MRRGLGVKAIRMGLTLGLALAMAGCATLGGESAPEAEARVLAQVRLWADSVQAKDFDGVLALYSVDFKSKELKNKPAVRDYLDRVGAAGWLEGVAMDVTGVKVEHARRGRYIAGPIDITGKFSGTLSYTLVFAQEAGEMKIVSSESSGM